MESVKCTLRSCFVNLMWFKINYGGRKELNTLLFSRKLSKIRIFSLLQMADSLFLEFQWSFWFLVRSFFCHFLLVSWLKGWGQNFSQWIQTLHFIVCGWFSDRDGWHGSCFQENVIPSLSGEVETNLSDSQTGCDVPNVTKWYWNLQPWNGRCFLVHFPGCIRPQVTEHINNVNFSLFIKEDVHRYQVCGEDSALVWIFDTGVLFSH